MEKRNKIVAGNWKMHGSRALVQSLVTAIKEGAASLSDQVDVILFPSFVHVPLVNQLLENSAVMMGAQTLDAHASGAFTGEISGPMLIDYGCRYVLVGHSERRHLFHEGLSVVAEKFKAALRVGLQPILCVGETLPQREQGLTENIIHEQLASVIEAVSIDAFQQAVIAYEPVWAIGTGLTATPDEAQTVHRLIRQQLADCHRDIANAVRILYGGSVKADNAKGLFAMPDIDGGLIGGASLEATGFLAICHAAV